MNDPPPALTKRAARPQAHEDASDEDASEIQYASDEGPTASCTPCACGRIPCSLLFASVCVSDTACAVLSLRSEQLGLAHEPARSAELIDASAEQCGCARRLR